MLKMCIPQEAVHHKMQREVSQKIYCCCLGTRQVRKGPSNIANSIRPGFHFFQNTSSLTDDEEVARILPQDAQASDSERPSAATNEEGRNRRKIIVAVVGVKLQQSGAVETKDDSKNGNKLVSLHWTPLSGKALDKTSGMQARSRMLRPRSPKVVTFRS
jgi:hypothetical protein